MTKEKNGLSPDAGQALGKLVRESLEAAVKGGRYEPASPGLEELEAHCGCFVTLKTGGNLRGCLGCFTSDRPIWRTAPEYARHSALEDPRFVGNRLTPEELPGVEISISVLSPLEPCADPEGIVLGRDGIYVKSPASGRSGCFLPSVARETGWTVEEFWGNCCRMKAGLDWDAWKRPGADLFTFTADEVEA